MIAILSLASLPAIASAQDRKAEPRRGREAAPAAAPTPAPAPAAAAQGTVRARCNDGSAWSGANRQGACTNHGGVKEWIPGAAAADEHVWAANVMARCNDGTTWNNPTRQGACAAHGGVKKWRVDDDDEQGRPRDAKARCNDGTWWTSAARQGACTGHGGVHHWTRGAERGEAKGERH